MQYQPDIHTISRSAPPSYAEATGQSVPTGNNQYVPRPGQSTHEHEYTQMPANTPYPTYQQADNFYSNISAQPSYNPVYVVGQENQPATTHHIHCRRKNERYASCNKKIVMYLISMIIFILLIKLVILPFIFK